MIAHMTARGWQRRPDRARGFIVFVSTPAGNQVPIQLIDNRVGQNLNLADPAADLVTGGDIVPDSYGAKLNAAGGPDLRNNLVQMTIRQGLVPVAINRRLINRRAIRKDDQGFRLRGRCDSLRAAQSSASPSTFSLRIAGDSIVHMLSRARRNGKYAALPKISCCGSAGFLHQQ